MKWTLTCSLARRSICIWSKKLFPYRAVGTSISSNLASHQGCFRARYARNVLQQALEEGQRSSALYRKDAESLKLKHRDIVMIAAWRRPAFLLRTLAHLMRAAGGADQFYLVLLDLHSSVAVEEVAAALPVPHLLLRMPPHFFMQAGVRLQKATLLARYRSRQSAGVLCICWCTTAFLRVGQLLLAAGRLPLCSLTLRSTGLAASLSRNQLSLFAVLSVDN